VSIVQQYPCFIDENDIHLLERPCTKNEILTILKVFAKEKSLGSDGWTMEFFLLIFDMVGNDLLEVV
jgi:hypothetical protein